jgi:hypothetical protein
MRVDLSLLRSLTRRAFRMFWAIGLVAAAPLTAQTGSGRVVGRVVAADGGAPISGARVVVVGSTLSTSTRVDGRFTITNVPAGTISLRAAMIGFSPAVIGIVVAAIVRDILQGDSLCPVTMRSTRFLSPMRRRCHVTHYPFSQHCPCRNTDQLHRPRAFASTRRRLFAHHQSGRRGGAG